MSQTFLDSKMLPVGKILSTACTYKFDYYQRHYAWTEENINDLISDLTGEFQSKYSVTQSYDIDSFPSYFLGTIIVTEINSEEYSVIDGQQRLTSVTLMLLALLKVFKKAQKEQGIDLTNIISRLSNSLFSSIYSDELKWHVERPEAKELIEALYAADDISNISSQILTTSDVENIFERYKNLIEYFETQSELTIEKGLVDFSFWVLNNVKLNRIITESEAQAYKIFETQNDRGLSLAPYDMLKALLLSRIKDKTKLQNATIRWNEEIEKLSKRGKKTVGDFFRDFLRSQYTDFADAAAGQIEYDRFATEYHRWVSENISTRMGLNSEDDIYDFITKTLPKYIEAYNMMLDKGKDYDHEYSSVYYNSQQSYLIQNMIMLSAILQTDDNDKIAAKIKKVSSFIEIYITRLIWEDQSWKPNYTKFDMVKRVMPKIRSHRNSIETLTAALKELLGVEGSDGYKFESQPTCTGSNRKFIRNILARITDLVQIAATSDNGLDKSKSLLKDYMKYEVEHIMANKYETQWANEFSDDEEFQKARNELGSLLLLSKSENTSFNDMPYADKVEGYGLVSNYLAKTLYEKCYDENNEDFAKGKGLSKLTNFAAQYDIKFVPYQNFGPEPKDQRNKLYRKLANIIWDSNKI